MSKPSSRPAKPKPAAGPPFLQPKLIFFGDPHGDFKPVIRAVQRYRPEAIVLLGDLQARQPLHIELEPILDLTEIWFIHGNHDTDSESYHDNCGTPTSRTATSMDASPPWPATRWPMAANCRRVRRLQQLARCVAFNDSS